VTQVKNAQELEIFIILQVDKKLQVIVFDSTGLVCHEFIKSQLSSVAPVFVDQEFSLVSFQESDDPELEISSRLFICIILFLKFVGLLFSKILKFTLNCHVQKITVFGLHLFSSQVIAHIPKSISQAYFVFGNHEIKESSKLKLTLHSSHLTQLNVVKF
jgi:hypothetical protein